ncbi:MAG: hypothetical protein M1533_02170 [Candidatus Thermoplasmatota archaeon]|jgi:hypothetical protein|nr:hypothetical protein [Candidatus Thermoplasmatota archaeon]MCL5794233.1 hypothetical protein [Candidatus Thermoplasmatota archaeon]
MIRVYSLDKANQAVIDSLKNDDIVGRQSITVRNSELFGLPGETVTVIIEGSEESLKKAEELGKGSLKVLDSNNTQKVISKIREEEDKSDQGLGFIFE